MFRLFGLRLPQLSPIIGEIYTKVLEGFFRLMSLIDKRTVEDVLQCYKVMNYTEYLMHREISLRLTISWRAEVYRHEFQTDGGACLAVEVVGISEPIRTLDRGQPGSPIQPRSGVGQITLPCGANLCVLSDAAIDCALVGPCV